MRRKGLRPVQAWVPDTRTDVFISECRRQARLAARSAQEKLALDFISEIADRDCT
ncbi:antitoxin MazE family protein [Nitrospira sp. BLG_1]|uniref:antitoxin MazE family protein n=1 Tax=Nitrospira sp. BLG_1 TaxID=3395883 RepID=UPI0039BC50A5